MLVTNIQIAHILRELFNDIHSHIHDYHTYTSFSHTKRDVIKAQ